MHAAVRCNGRRVNYTHHTQLCVVTRQSVSPHTTLSSVFQAVRKPLCRGHHIRLNGSGKDSPEWRLDFKFFECSGQHRVQRRWH